ncbi:mucin TcMUCII [Trypanosoma cruzi cruzi]|uniref:Putative mucin TcMUCII n=1 Tax=Trypanosoma cruzi TaxID=5693 RepID=A0A2V2V391_TRYCR|nr:mucin TcMUCII [Trypanosoma cruzi cruzi]PWU88873.1 putative mucin TcMUCII [Trypanosoma cruzi]
MMTCRLLCALLVLVLCCCPSVCADETPKDTETVEESTEISTQPPDPKNNPKPGAQAHLGVSISSSSSTEGIQAKDHSGPSAPTVTRPAEKPGDDAGAGQRLTGTPGLQSDTNKSADLTDKEAEDPAKTTTTTTTAPEAPSTTTTETPTSTTTRVPSRLREIDSSLSSSAWVCAPMLLAASVLAYTAMG